ncbi:MAG: type I glyceraldehyde-3-phosphate dehydrogenase [Candidatus Paceibacterota bacterium]|jgi:glyceraldehyde 3-phosphate dehydrogenase
MRIAINGFGRIGRAFFRIAFGEADLEIVAINDLGDLENLAYLLKHDTVYGTYQKNIQTLLPNKLIVDKKEIVFLQEKDPVKLPWKDLKIDIIIESTGAFEDYNKAKAHILAGAKKVIITAPAKGEEGKEGKIVLLGINEEDLKKFEVISNGSCTTNAVSSVIYLLNERLGIKKAILNTVHAYTATQNLVDGPTKGKDYLRGRAAGQNIVPSTTGAAIAVTKVIQDLENKFDGLAIRVPVICGSIADLTFVSQRETTPEEINGILRKASQEDKWENILGVSEEPLVSSDIIKDFRPAIVDLTFTRVVDKDLIKVLVWYDNEWGYSWTLVEQLKRLKL